MDDWCLQAKTRWHLKKAIKKMNQVLGKLKVLKHPDKTETGRIENRTFTFLGYESSKTTLRIARPTLENFNEHVAIDFQIMILKSGAQIKFRLQVDD
jgi:RNA-directed DNA polymerase